MTDLMTCEAFEGLLPRYLEDEVEGAERRRVESHAAGCAACGALLAGVREITREAAELPALVPSRDLWDGIASRIEAPAIPLDSRRGAAVATGSPKRQGWGVRWMAAAAAALVITTAGVTHVVTRQMMAGDAAQLAVTDVAPEPGPFVTEPASGGSDAATAPAPVAGQPGAGAPEPDRAAAEAPRAGSQRQAPRPATAGTGSLVSQPHAAEAVYDEEIAQLQETLERRRAELDPATTVVLENNLRIIDRAIRDSRAALERDPASGFLTDQLTMALQKKLQLMRTAALLPSRT